MRVREHELDDADGQRGNQGLVVAVTNNTEVHGGQQPQELPEPLPQGQLRGRVQQRADRRACSSSRTSFKRRALRGTTLIATCVWSIFDLLIRLWGGRRGGGGAGRYQNCSRSRVDSSLCGVQFLTSCTRTSPTNSEDAEWTRAWTTMTRGNGEAGGAGLPPT